MSKSAVLSPKAKNKVTIELFPEASPNGEVTATIPVSWTFNEDAMAYIAAHRNDSPHLVLFVTSLQESTYTTHDYSAAEAAQEAAHEKGADISEAEYRALVVSTPVTRFRPDTTSVQLIPLFNRKGQPTTPKTYVSFRRPGRNVISAVLTTFTHKDKTNWFRGWEESPDRTTLELNDDKLEFTSYYHNEFLTKGSVGLSHREVSVPAEMFAKERPAWQKALVGKFFRGRENDECHFRKRLWFVAIPATVPVQLYAVIVRLAILLFGVFAGMRRTFSKEFFAFNPHDYARSMESSWWWFNRHDEMRSSWRVILSPPGLAIMTMVFGVALLPGLATLGISTWISGENQVNDFWKLLWVAGVVDAGLALLVLVLILIFTKKGRAWFSKYVSTPLRREEPGKEVAQPNADELKRRRAEQQRLAIEQLRLSQANAANPNNLENNTVKLKFLDLKSKVCLPFAKP